MYQILRHFIFRFERKFAGLFVLINNGNFVGVVSKTRSRIAK